ncbi:hypothetical protein [Microbacterium sp. NPDC057650]|uniref:hypothetical protein n=1 Tax=unclassified Microbacterium TaxID=2609290 RepID=UPI00366B4699
MLTTGAAVTVLDDGDGAELCLGALLESYPPQCGGPKLVGWDWSEWPGTYEQASDVRWGLYRVDGTYDPEAFAFTPTGVRPGATASERGGQSRLQMFATPCAEPKGGWRVIDPARTTPETMDRVFARAARLPGYAVSWVDRSRVPSAGPDATPEEQVAETAPSPELTVVNVRVTGDPVAAEKELREVWGGMLCVTTAEHTAAELNGIAEKIRNAASDPRVWLGVNADDLGGYVSVQVVYDDGALQRRMDAEYGAGLVLVTSSLRPVP